MNEAEIDNRAATLLKLEIPGLVYDLCDHYGCQTSKSEVFWEKAKEFLEKDVGVGTVMHDWRYSVVINIAKAIRVRYMDLRE